MSFPDKKRDTGRPLAQTEVRHDSLNGIAALAPKAERLGLQGIGRVAPPSPAPTQPAAAQPDKSGPAPAPPAGSSK